MAWTPSATQASKPFLEDYPALIALRKKYPPGRGKPAPIEELKAACLADGYKPEVVAKMKYQNVPEIEDRWFSKKRKVPEIKKEILAVSAPENEDVLENEVSDDESEHGNEENYVNSENED